MVMTKITSNSVALAGEFAVLSQLALRGYDANMTLGHTKGVDILVSDPRTDKMFRLEVKTNFKNSQSSLSKSKLMGTSVSAWIMNEKHETIIDPKLFYCFVNISKETNAYRFFIVPSDVVAKYVRESHKFWMKADDKHNDGPMRMFRVGVDDEKYNVETPVAERYENNWMFLR